MVKTSRRTGRALLNAYGSRTLSKRNIKIINYLQLMKLKDQHYYQSLVSELYLMVTHHRVVQDDNIS
jgi:hypothetical protein